MVHTENIKQWIEVLLSDPSYGWSHAPTALSNALGFRVKGTHIRWKEDRLSLEEWMFAASRIDMIKAGTLKAKLIKGSWRATLVYPPEPPNGRTVVARVRIGPEGVTLVH